jgi:vacuolar-type H+-ATPase subunit E/Vma4
VRLARHVQILAVERDRRYAEVSLEREKAQKIREEADRRALQLADSIQQYKDEKANELRSQIERERGNYATQSDLKALAEKLEALIKPLAEFTYGLQGRSGARTDSRLDIGAVLQALAVLAAIAAILIIHH